MVTERNFQEELMVHVEGLTKYFLSRKKNFFEKPGVVRALDGINFSIKKGHTLGMVGESGSGKTTAARAMLRLIEPDAGNVVIDGINIKSLDRKELRAFRKNIQIVFQDPFSALNPRMTVGRIISEPLRIHTNMKKEETKDRLEELMTLVGLGPEHVERYPHEFSGGQRQRIGIARAIALNPKLIILDEPVSALDVSIQGQILNLLKELQERLSLTFLFVAHDLAVVEHMSNHIAVMYLGRIVENRSTSALYAEPLHPYTKSLIASIPEIKPEKRGFTALKGEIPSPENPPEGCHFHTRCPHAMEICKKTYPEEQAVDGGTVRCHLYQS